MTESADSKSDRFISNLEYMRIKRGFRTMAELAKDCGVSLSTLFRLTMGESKSPKVDTLYALGKSLRVPWWTLTEIDYKKVDVDLIDFQGLLEEQKAKIGLSRQVALQQCEVAVSVAVNAIKILPYTDFEISEDNQSKLASAIAFYLSQTSMESWDKVEINDSVAHATQTFLLEKYK